MQYLLSSSQYYYLKYIENMIDMGDVSSSTRHCDRPGGERVNIGLNEITGNDVARPE